MPSNDFSSTPLSRRVVLQRLAEAGAVASLPLRVAAAAQRDNALLPFNLEVLPRSGKTVLAHWHFFPISIDNKPPEQDYYATNYLSPDGEGGRFSYCGGYFRERPLPRASIDGADWQRQDLLTDVRLANAIGIDAFQYNVGDLSPTGASWQRLIDLLEVCRISGAAFRIMPCIDCASIDALSIQNKLAEALSTILQHEALFRDSRGKVIISFFVPERHDAAAWSGIARRLRDSHLNISLFSMFLSAWTVARRLDLLEMSDLVSIWSGDFIDSLERLNRVAQIVNKLGKRWVAPIWTQDFRAKSGTFIESRNSELFREAWRQVIDNRYDFVNFLTWNDYSEGSELRPSSSIRYSFYDLAAYFIQWLKSGRRPLIQRDVLYYFHRVNLVGSTRLLKQEQSFRAPYGPLTSNDVEAVPFLFDAGQIEIRVGRTVKRFDAPRGVSAFRVPAEIGRPTFRLLRNGEAVMSLTSDFEIVGASDYQDLLYHGGSSDRAE